MPAFPENKLVFRSTYRQTIQKAVNRILYVYGDWTAANNFLDDVEDAINRLKYVDDTYGLPADTLLRDLGYKRMLLRHYKYIVVYKYRTGHIVHVFGVYHSSRNIGLLLS